MKSYAEKIKYEKRLKIRLSQFKEFQNMGIKETKRKHDPMVFIVSLFDQKLWVNIENKQGLLARIRRLVATAKYLLIKKGLIMI